MALVGGSISYLLHGDYLTGDTLRKLLFLSNIDSLLIASGLFLLCQYIATLRLKHLASLIGYQYSLGTLFRLNMIGNFFNFALPGQVGGDVVRGYLLAKEKSGREGAPWGIVVTDRALGLLSLITISGTLLLYLAFFFEIPHYTSTMRVMLSVIGVVMIMVPLAVPLLFRPGGFLYQIVIKLLIGKLDGSVIHHILYTVYVYVRKMRHLGIVFMYSILIQVFGLLAIWVLAGIASVQPEQILPVLAASSVVILLSTIPVTLGNLGWTELLASLSWSAIGSDAGGEVFLYWRLVALFCSLPGGVLYMVVSKPLTEVGGGKQD